MRKWEKSARAMIDIFYLQNINNNNFYSKLQYFSSNDKSLQAFLYLHQLFSVYEYVIYFFLYIFTSTVDKYLFYRNTYTFQNFTLF